MPVFVNFVSIIVTIMALFQYSLIFIVYQPFLIAYNLLVISFYLNLGAFNRDNSTLLNLGTGSKSYWFTYSSLSYYGSQCLIIEDDPDDGSDSGTVISGNSCSLLPYFVIESTQAALHVLLSVS